MYTTKKKHSAWKFSQTVKFEEVFKLNFEAEKLVKVSQISWRYCARREREEDRNIIISSHIWFEIFFFLFVDFFLFCLKREKLAKHQQKKNWKRLENLLNSGKFSICRKNTERGENCRKKQWNFKSTVLRILVTMKRIKEFPSAVVVVQWSMMRGKMLEK